MNMDELFSKCGMKNVSSKKPVVAKFKSVRIEIEIYDSRTLALFSMFSEKAKARNPNMIKSIEWTLK